MVQTNANSQPAERAIFLTEITQFLQANQIAKQLPICA
jgi:hypothetical protein